MIEVRDLERSFGPLRVLRGLRFEVDAGEALFVLGPSGAGKSTLLRCLNGLVLPGAGTVRVGGLEVRRGNLGAIRRRVGFIFQGSNLIDNRTVLQNVLVGRLAEKRSWSLRFDAEDRRIAAEAIEAVGLGDKVDARANTLSGGQRQRVGIARALAHRPDVLLADEPISNLDPVTGREVLDLLRRIGRERGMTLVCNLHDVGHAARLADRVLGLREGQVRFLGTPAELGPAELAAIYGERPASAEPTPLVAGEV